ncbi:MAG: PKD domain-containing protein [Phycisphaerales bacterium]
MAPEDVTVFKLHVSQSLSSTGFLLLILGVGVGLIGCREDSPKPASPSAQKSPDKPAANTVADTHVAATSPDPFDLPVPVAPPQLPVQRRIEEGGVTLAGTQELAAVIGQAQVKAIQPDQLASPAAEALREARNLGLILGSQVIDITPPAPYDHGQYLPADLQVVLPLTAEQSSGATPRNVGVVYLSARGPVYLDGYYDQARSAVVVQVPHLSGFISFRRDPMQEITDAIAEEASRRAWGYVEEAREKLEEKLLESAGEYLEKQAFEKLDGGIKRKILLGLVTHREAIGSLFSASGAQDPASFCQAFQLLMGKIIVDNVPASGLRSVLEAAMNSTDTVAAVAQAGGQAAGGDYWAAVEILGKLYSESTPIYQLTVQAAAIMDVGWSMLKDDALEAFYEEYKAGTFVPERVTRREDILRYLKRKFPKPDGTAMTDTETAKFVEDNFAQRQSHEKETAKREAEIKKIYEWYLDHPLVRSTIEKRFNTSNRADCFRRFLRILDSVDGHLVRLGIRRSPWARDGAFMPQPETVELVNAFQSGGAPAFNRTLKEIERRLAKPLDLRGYTGFWILEESKQDVLSSRSPAGDSEYRLDASAQRTGPHTYVGSVRLADAFIRQSPGQVGADRVGFTYEAVGTIAFDNPPSVVPNGTNWDVSLRVTLKETCSSDWAEAAGAIAARLGSMQPLSAEGTPPRHVHCHAGVLRSEENRVRVRSEDDLAPTGPTLFAAADGKPWSQPVRVRFTLIPETMVSTAERFILILNAYTPAGTFREQHVYRWTKELPKSLESELHRQISRASFQGVRSGKPDMSEAVVARPAEPPAPAQTAAGSQARITQLRYVPEQLVVQREAAFEVTVENGPRVPSFEWSFGESSPARTDSWTTVGQCQYTYFKAGTFTITVKLRDKNNYAKGHLATASWQVTVVSEEQESTPDSTSPAAQ